MAINDQSWDLAKRPDEKSFAYTDHSGLMVGSTGRTDLTFCTYAFKYWIIL